MDGGAVAQKPSIANRNGCAQTNGRKDAGLVTALAFFYLETRYRLVNRK
jgi:hypothetical protein